MVVVDLTVRMINTPCATGIIAFSAIDARSSSGLCILCDIGVVGTDVNCSSSGENVELRKDIGAI